MMIDAPLFVWKLHAGQLEYASEIKEAIRVAREEFLKNDLRC
jgi:hypothetical protein